MRKPKLQNYEHAAKTIIQKLNSRGMAGAYYETAEEAVQAVQRMLTPGCSVSWGGSETLVEIGLPDVLRASDCQVYDRKEAKTPEEARALYGKIVTADYYFMSANAITLDGQLVNIDGLGNRVACLCHGPEHVIVIAGMNKVSADLESAVKRVRNLAAPANCVRLSRNTPCASLGRCADCLSDDCICAQIVVTRKSMQKNRIQVLLVGQELGY